VSSALHRAEVPRTVWQAEPGALPRSYKVIKRIARVALSPDVLDDSATLPPQELSPAQAVHLASALAVKRDLTAFVSYDEPLLAAARDAGLPVAGAWFALTNWPPTLVRSYSQLRVRVASGLGVTAGCRGA